MLGIPLLGSRSEAVGILILLTLALTPFILNVRLLFALIRRLASGKKVGRRLIFVTLAADLICVLCALDAWFIEPHMLTVTRISAASPKITSATGSLKIVHISDIHFEQHSPYTRRILSTIAAERPDIIVVSGDNPQMRYFNRDQFFEFLKSLKRIAPVYMSPGYYEDTVDMLMSPVAQTYLEHGEHAALNIRGTKIVIQGFGPNEPVMQTSRVKGRDALYLVLDHTPDAIQSVSRLNPDWCFVGHTHGGQVRLPIWGAVTTLSLTGKKYEYGHYRIGKTNVFVSRGLGLEPRPAPQVRFLCPPEIVVLTISKGNPSKL